MESVLVRSIPGHTYTVAIEDGRHEFLSDENAAVGGADEGPSPYDLLLGSLGSCMAITLKMYAQRKQWPVESVTITLTHAKILAADCMACTPEEIAAAGPQTRIDVITTNLQVTGDLSAEQVERLHEIAGRCPVHRTLEAAPKFVSTITHQTD